jgi:hypothetical protein
MADRPWIDLVDSEVGLIDRSMPDCFSVLFLLVFFNRLLKCEYDVVTFLRTI